MNSKIICGNSLDVVMGMSRESVNCIVTSPPYYGLRDYGVAEQIGLEESPEAYIEKLVKLFRECRRVLAKDGTFWLNLGDSYAANRGYLVADSKHTNVGNSKQSKVPQGLKEKDLMMIPARVALALQADGWYLRSQIIWHKPNAMPESVKDRPTNDYELVYLLTKSASYFYDADAIREPHQEESMRRAMRGNSAENKYASGSWRPTGVHPNTMSQARDYKGYEGMDEAIKNGETPLSPNGRNKRAVWSINTQPYRDAHFATMPLELAETCIKAGCPHGGIVLDPFGGSGTTGEAAIGLNRDYRLIELNPEYVLLAEERVANVQRALF